MNKVVIAKPKDIRGYTPDELALICAKLDIDPGDFNVALGTNTCIRNEEGIILTYPCDVENTLAFLSSGKYLFFD